MGKIERAAAILKVVVLAAAIQGVKSQGGHDDEKGDGMWVMKLALAVYTTAVIALTILLWICLKEGVAPSKNSITK